MGPKIQWGSLLSLIAAVLMASMPVGAAAATAKHKPRNHALDEFFVGSVVIPSTPQNPQRTVAGYAAGTLGTGAVTYQAKYAGVARNRVAFYEPMTLFFARGTVRAVVTGLGTEAADGSEVFTGRARIVGGTGRWAKASGTAALTGSASAFNDVTHLRLTHQRLRGTITF